MTILLGQLAHSPADIFRKLLIDKNFGSAQGASLAWPITADTELDLPDNFICVTNTVGETYGRIQVTGEQPEHFGIQVKTRGSLPYDCWNKMNAICVAMDQSLSFNVVNLPPIASIAASQYRIGAITRKGGVLSVGREQGASKRFIYTLNAVFVCHQLS